MRGTGTTFDGHFQLPVGERHKLGCVYSFTDPLTPATPPVSPLGPDLSGGLSSAG